MPVDAYKSTKFKFSKRSRSTEKIQQIKFNYFDKNNKEPGYNARSTQFLPMFQSNPSIYLKKPPKSHSTFGRTVKFIDL